jgi:cholesterol transport system auxiliary component
MSHRVFFKNLLAVLLASFLLSSCSLLSPVKINPPANYVLQDPTLEKTLPAVKSTRVLLVTKIFAPTWLNTQHMAYQNNKEQIDYFAKNQWVASPNQLLQPIVVHALQNSGMYRAIVASPFSGDYDQRLEIQLLNFQQVFVQDSSYYWFTVQARLVKNNNQKIIATKRFNFEIPAPTANPAGGVEAANQAIRVWLPQLIHFARAYKNR